ncbi:hypothetical protein [Bariatricus sp. HCP28S3_D3]|uniref:hypothetical protein n=1 Tax=Bariatricus sp. HCP28S3_D3 TaxID=3438901 RepID=UPI003F88C181
MAVNKVVYGATVLVDLTEDTVSASDLAEGITAHSANGELVTGNLKENNLYSNSTTVDKYITASNNYVKLSGEAKYDTIIRQGTVYSLLAKQSEFGDALASDVAKGKTFTSANGLKLTGTMESGGTVVSDDNCEAYHITSASTALNFKRTGGTIKVWGYGYKSSGMYQKTVYAFCGDGYYTGTSYGTPTKTSVTWGLNSYGTLSGLPSGLNALNVIVTKGV